jgi:hypothetical protein
LSGWCPRSLQATTIRGGGQSGYGWFYALVRPHARQVLRSRDVEVHGSNPPGYVTGRRGAEHWLANYILNTILRVNVPAPQRQQLFNFLRRSHSTFEEYALARNLTLAFLGDRERNLSYLKAIDHWEAFLAYSWQAYGFLSGGKVQFFKKGDGSLLERLNSLHNQAKHADEAIQRGDFLEDSPLCVWLTNEGLRSTETLLTFNEVVEILEELAQWASAAQDPLTMREKLVQAGVASPPTSGDLSKA